MGKLTRRVKFIAQERRLSIPADFLHLHGIERGDEIVLAALGEKLYAFPLPMWERQREMAGHVQRWFPEQDHPFLALTRAGTPLRLGSQDRVVLPRDFPFALGDTVRLHWDLVDGVLVMEPERNARPGRPALSTPPGQVSLFDVLAPRAGAEPRFDRERASKQLVEEISVARIDWRDHRFGDGDAAPGEALIRSIKVEGIRRPLVLREKDGGGYHVVDGFRRLAAARQLRIRSVPAIVWRGIDEEACARLKLMEAGHGPAEEGGTLQRLQSTVRLHEDQVALREIEHITGRRKRTLQRYLRVAHHDAVRAAVESGRLSIFKAEEILKAGVDAEQAIRESWTVKTIRQQGRARGARRLKRRNHGSGDA